MTPPAEFDVVIVGAGPCGLVTANLLLTYGVRTLVVERELEPLDYPRAVGIDDEALRSCQTFGAIHDVLRDTVQNTPIRYYTSWGRCLAHVKPSAQPFGWPRRNLFLQPMFEATLRAHLRQQIEATQKDAGSTVGSIVETRYGWELRRFAQDADGVTVVVSDPHGVESEVRTRFLVGTDGGKSSIRRDLGVELLGETNAVRWLVVDVANDALDAPYSAVYCDPEQPVLMIPLPYRHRRWEFLVPTDADEATMTSPEHVLSLLRPRYGDVPLPDVLRARVYLHHSRTADRFQVGRVFLAGDAAHLQPPFFGQGMNSGLRDATNLAWKLAAVLRGQADEQLLATYDAERRPHAAEMVQFATRMGRMYRPHSRATERVRDGVFRAIQTFPGGRDYILQMKYKPMPHYTNGAVVHAPPIGAGAVGRMFMQPEVERADGTRCKLDDAIGTWFAVLGIGFDPRECLSQETRAWFERLEAQFVRVDRSKSQPRSLRGAVASASGNTPGPSSASSCGGDLLIIQDVDGAFRDGLLAKPNDEFVVLRPDRYVAAVADRASADAISHRLRLALQSV